MRTAAPQGRGRQRGPRPHHRRRCERRGTGRLPQVVDAVTQVPAEGVPPAEDTRPGQRLEAARRAQPPLAPETVALIRAMAVAHRTWGAERLRGELPKRDIRVAKSTVQEYARAARPPQRAGPPWATFLRKHAPDIWVGDFLPVNARFFRQVWAFCVIELGSRRVVHVGVTRHPTDAGVAQQLREATPFEERPPYRIRDNDSKYGRVFGRVAAASGIMERRTAYRAPRQNATCARFFGSVRRACLDRLLVPGAAHVRRVLREYVRDCNHDRPHQGTAQQIPIAAEGCTGWAATDGNARASAILGGLHHAYARAA